MRGLLSSARYRLKWSQLLLSHPEHQVCAASMRNGFMTLMIGLSGVPDADELMPFLQDAYRLWGGQGYYMSSPPRHPLKRLVAESTLRLGGLVALNWLEADAARRAESTAFGGLRSARDRSRQRRRRRYPFGRMKLRVSSSRKYRSPAGWRRRRACGARSLPSGRAGD